VDCGYESSGTFSIWIRIINIIGMVKTSMLNVIENVEENENETKMEERYQEE
jgi:hypothetical protein